MAIERERRWLVMGFDPKVLSNRHVEIQQGYVSGSTESMRVRIVDGKKGTFTYKRGKGIQRDEKEIPVELAAAKFVLAGCKFYLRKTRYYVDGWELDIFQDELQGYVLAEFESPKCDTVAIPPWLLEATEVTNTLTSRQLARLAFDRRGRTRPQIAF